MSSYRCTCRSRYCCSLTIAKKPLETFARCSRSHLEALVPYGVTVPSVPSLPEGRAVLLFPIVPTHPRPSPLARLVPPICQRAPEPPHPTTEVAEFVCSEAVRDVEPVSSTICSTLHWYCYRTSIVRFTFRRFLPRTASTNTRLAGAAPLPGPVVPRTASVRTVFTHIAVSVCIERPRLVRFPPLRMGWNFPSALSPLRDAVGC